MFGHWKWILLGFVWFIKKNLPKDTFIVWLYLLGTFFLLHFNFFVAQMFVRWCHMSNSICFIYFKKYFQSFTVCLHVGVNVFLWFLNGNWFHSVLVFTSNVIYFKNPCFLKPVFYFFPIYCLPWHSFLTLFCVCVYTRCVWVGQSVLSFHPYVMFL